MVKIAKKSKRLSCRKKFKIAKKVREHNRKERKEAKKGPSLKRRKKDGVIPNNFPMKEEILKEAEDIKNKREEEKQTRREQRKMDRDKLVNEKRGLEDLVIDAEARQKKHQSKSSLDVDTDKEYKSGKVVENSLKAYYKEFRKVIDAADVVLEILDARDPLGSRCPQVEQAVLGCGADKRLVLILNKIDLVPKENVEAWLKYLKNEFPTIAFKASTQTQKANLSRSRVPIKSATNDLRQGSTCLGSDVLMKLLGNYCRNKDIKTSIRVGVVGFPNTGKSSIINSLKRTKACSVGSTPGVTRSMQEVQLDKHVKLLDSPGIVMAHGNSDAATILRNCVKVETVEDPVPAVSAILRRCSKDQLMLHYKISEFGDVHEFLSLLAIKTGRLRKGGVPDSRRAGKQLLQDWNTGKLKYHTQPPDQQSLPAHLNAQIVTEMAKEFDIDALLQDEKDTLKGLRSSNAKDLLVETGGPLDAEMEDDDEEEYEDMEDDGDDEPHTEELENVKVSLGKAAKETTKTQRSMEKKNTGNEPRPSPMLKKEMKKMKKNKKRADKLAGKLSDALTGAMAGLRAGADDDNEDYDFETHFK